MISYFNFSKLLRRHSRSLISYVLLFGASLCCLVYIVARTINQNMLLTDRFVSIMTPLTKHDDVAEAISTFMMARLLSDKNLNQKPLFLSPLAAPLSDFVASQVIDYTTEFVKSEKFDYFWSKTVRHAHLSFLDQINTDVYHKPSTFALSMPLADLQSEIIDFLHTKDVPISSERLAKLDLPTVLVLTTPLRLDSARYYVRTIQNLNKFLPYVTLLLFFGGIALVKNKKKAVIITAGLVAIEVWLTIVVVNVVIMNLTHHMSNPVYARATTGIYQAFYYNVVSQLNSTISISLLVMSLIILLDIACRSKMPLLKSLRLSNRLIQIRKRTRK